MALVRDHAAVVAGDRVMIVDTRTAAATAIEIEAICDVAPVGHEIWIAAGHLPALHRIDVHTGREVGSPVALPGDRTGTLRAVSASGSTPAGAQAAAVWTSQPTLITSAGSMTRVPGEWTEVFPVSASRWLVAAGERVVARPLPHHANEALEGEE